MYRMIEAVELHLFDLLLKAVHLHPEKSGGQRGDQSGWQTRTGIPGTLLLGIQQSSESFVIVMLALPFFHLLWVKTLVLLVNIKLAGKWMFIP